MSAEKTVNARVAERYLSTKNERFSVVIKDDRPQLEILKDLNKILRTAGLNVVEVNQDSEKV